VACGLTGHCAFGSGRRHAMRLGLVGGTFDPVHLGHLDIALAAQRALALDEVWLVPSATPPHRHPPGASAAHRLAMVTMAADGLAHLAAADIEIDRPGPSYTVDTIDGLLRNGHRGRDVFFITGADAFGGIATWKDYPHLLDRCHFVVVSRPGAPVTELPERLPTLAARMIESGTTLPDAPAIVLIDAPTAPVSSTEIRSRCRLGAPLTGMVTPGVADYIVRHGLYEWPGPSENERKGAA